MESERMATGMDEYVEREEIRRAYEKLTRSYVNGDPYIADWRFDEMIENLHAADVAPVRHGRWIDKGEYAVCMECCGRSGTQYDGVEPLPLMTQFCPNCGAKMDGDMNDRTKEKLVELSDIQVLQREIECVKRKSYTDCTDCFNCDLLMTDERILSAYANAIDALQNANGVTVQEWISVDDELPEEKANCIVYYKHAFCDDENHVGICVCFYDAIRCFFQRRFSIYHIA